MSSAIYPRSAWATPPRLAAAAVIATVCLACAPLLLDPSTQQGMDQAARFDEVPATLQNPLVTQPSFDLPRLLASDFWGTDMHSAGSHRSWRPTASAWFWLLWRVGGGQAWPFRVASFLLRCLLCLLLLHTAHGAVTWRAALGETQAWAVAGTVACLFAAHALHSDTVAFAVGQADMFAACVTLYGVNLHLAWLKAPDQPSLLSGALQGTKIAALTVLACSFKETGVALAGIVLVLDVGLLLLPALVQAKEGRHPPLSGPDARAGVLALGTALWLYVRLKVVQPGPPTFPPHMNPIATHPNTAVRLATYAWTASQHFAWLVLPWPLCVDWANNAITPITTVFDTRNVMTVLVLSSVAGATALAIMLWARWVAAGAQHRTMPLATMLAAALTFLPFLPGSNLLFPVGFVLAERIMLLPSAGAAVALAVALSTAGGGGLAHSFRTRVMPLCILAMLLYTAQRMYILSDTDRMAADWLATTPHSQKAWQNMLRPLEGQGLFLPTDMPSERQHCYAMPGAQGAQHNCSGVRLNALRGMMEIMARPPSRPCDDEPGTDCDVWAYDVARPRPSTGTLALQAWCAANAARGWHAHPPSPEAAHWPLIPVHSMSAVEVAVCSHAWAPVRTSSAYIVAQEVQNGAGVGDSDSALVLGVMRAVVQLYLAASRAHPTAGGDVDHALTAVMAMRHCALHDMTATRTSEAALEGPNDYVRNATHLLHDTPALAAALAAAFVDRKFGAFVAVRASPDILTPQGPNHGPTVDMLVALVAANMYSAAGHVKEAANVLGTLLLRHNCFAPQPAEAAVCCETVLVQRAADAYMAVAKAVPAMAAFGQENAAHIVAHFNSACASGASQ